MAAAGDPVRPVAVADRRQADRLADQGRDDQPVSPMRARGGTIDPTARIGQQVKIDRGRAGRDMTVGSRPIARVMTVPRAIDRVMTARRTIDPRTVARQAARVPAVSGTGSSVAIARRAVRTRSGRRSSIRPS